MIGARAGARAGAQLVPPIVLAGGVGGVGAGGAPSPMTRTAGAVTAKPNAESVAPGIITSCMLGTGATLDITRSNMEAPPVEDGVASCDTTWFTAAMSEEAGMAIVASTITPPELDWSRRDPSRRRLVTVLGVISRRATVTFFLWICMRPAARVLNDSTTDSLMAPLNAHFISGLSFSAVMLTPPMANWMEAWTWGVGAGDGVLSAGVGAGAGFAVLLLRDVRAVGRGSDRGVRTLVSSIGLRPVWL
mmetsp:Transcript_9760/g.30478  ORF Transcript_9760/g.30478 Transcript_9760/m.30478 type:complete len:247 (+) Transcript_9760:561-1301(+)